MQLIIDRFEGDMAVCEKPDREMLNIPRSQLPDGAKEGDVLDLEGDSIYIDAEATAQRKQSVKAKMKRLWRPSPPGRREGTDKG